MKLLQLLIVKLAVRISYIKRTFLFMKKLSQLGLLLICIGFTSCNNKEKAANKLENAEKPTAVQCYQSIYENDSINLKINSFKGGKVTGNMVMKISNMADKVGQIAGEFRGDTLFVDYSFIEGKNEKSNFKNPLALLKRGDELILGNGKIETYLGRSYFKKGEPIDFDNVRYKFTAVDCVE